MKKSKSFDLDFLAGAEGLDSRRCDAKPSIFRLCYAPRSVAALTCHRHVIHSRSPSSPSNSIPAKTEKAADWRPFLFCVTTTKNIRTVLYYKNSPAFFVREYTYPLVLTGVDSNRYLPGCQHHACNEAYVFFDFVSFGRIVLRIVSLRYRVFTLSYRLTIPHPIPLSLSANFCRILRFGCITER